MIANIEANETIKSLELALEDSQRKLYNERMNSQNLEYMLAGIREELQDISNKSPSEQSVCARSSISSLNSMQRYQAYLHRSASQTSSSSFSGRRSPLAAMTDPDEMRTRIKELESQKSALQDALRSLKERHELETKHNADRTKLLQNQLHRQRDASKAITTRRFTHEKDLLLLKDQISVMKTRLSSAQTGKFSLEKDLLDMKQQFKNISAQHAESQSRELTQVDALSQKLVAAKSQQKQSSMLAESYRLALHQLDLERQKMKDEHVRLTSSLHNNSQRLFEFSSQIQKLVEDNHAFSSSPYLGVSLLDQVKVSSLKN